MDLLLNSLKPSALLLLGSLTLTNAFAQDAGNYPAKPITIVVGYTAGGGVDAMARILAEKLPAALGQPVVIENRPGVGSIVGAAYVAKAKPDGYTLIMGAPGPFVFNHVLSAKLPYAQSDFVPIGLVGSVPLILLTQTSNSAKTVQELAAFSRQSPDKANYAASSSSFQLISELFNGRANAKFSHIPFKGVPEGITAVISGDVTMMLADAGPATAALQGGRVKALAVTAAQRLKDHPNVPTFAELGIDLKVALWFGLLAPAGTPPAIVKRLNEEITKIVAMPDVQRRMTGMSVIPTTASSDEFAKMIASEIPLWRKVAQDNNIQPN
jgi:tripartite-type tricarboxylate transporter receptor subunit TctC